MKRASSRSFASLFLQLFNESAMLRRGEAQIEHLADLREITGNQRQHGQPQAGEILGCFQLGLDMGKLTLRQLPEFGSLEDH
jgi:hypothetical protein